MRKSHGSKVRLHVACLVDLNDYLPSFPGSTPTHKIAMSELNEILLNSMPNSWSKQAYVQGFNWKYTTLKQSVNLFERMDIAEYIYKGVVEPSYIKNWGRSQLCWS